MLIQRCQLFSDNCNTLLSALYFRVQTIVYLLRIEHCKRLKATDLRGKSTSHHVAFYKQLNSTTILLWIIGAD